MEVAQLPAVKRDETVKGLIEWGGGGVGKSEGCQIGSGQGSLLHFLWVSPPSCAQTFFKMLVELQGEPMIDATTFANACVRMKGAATSIDLQTVMFTTHLMNQEQRRFFQSMYNRLMTIEHILHEEHSVDGENSIPGPFLTQSIDERADTLDTEGAVRTGSLRL